MYVIDVVDAFVVVIVVDLVVVVVDFVDIFYVAIVH